MAAPRDADALTSQVFVALREAGGAAAPDAAAHAAALALLDAHFPELRHFDAGAAVAASPAAGDADKGRGEYYRTTGALFALAASLAAAQDAAQREAALELLTAGERGPMSLSGPVGKAISMGHKASAWASFCEQLRDCLDTAEARWNEYVLVAIHDVGKSDAFRDKVNAHLPPAQRSDDHDRVLAAALAAPELCAELLPSVAALPRGGREALAAAAAAGFHLPQAGQGEAPLAQLAGLRNAVAREPALRSGRALEAYLYHSIFDVAGAACSDSFVLPLAIEPVFCGFTRAKDQLLRAMHAGDGEELAASAADVYYDFLWGAFAAAYPAFAAGAASERAAAAPDAWRAGTGLVLLRVAAMTRNSYAAPDALLQLLDAPGGRFAALARELSGRAPSPQVMLYYGPDLLRMGLGPHCASDPGGAGLADALEAVQALFALARAAAEAACSRWDGDAAAFPAYELNVGDAVAAVRAKGAAWEGGGALRRLLEGASVEAGACAGEGKLRLAPAAAAAAP